MTATGSAFSEPASFARLAAATIGAMSWVLAASAAGAAAADLPAGRPATAPTTAPATQPAHARTAIPSTANGTWPGFHGGGTLRGDAPPLAPNPVSQLVRRWTYKAGEEERAEIEGSAAIVGP